MSFLQLKFTRLWSMLGGAFLTMATLTTMMHKVRLWVFIVASKQEVQRTNGLSPPAGSEHAHKKPKRLYKQTNKQVSNYTYMRSIVKRAEVRLGFLNA